MKVKFKISIFISLLALMFFEGANSFAQDTIPGPNLFADLEFEFMTELAQQNGSEHVFMWPEDWVYVSDSAGEYHPLWGGLYNYPVFQCLIYEYPPDPVLYPVIGTWTGVPSVGSMYQEITGIDNGLYEFTINASTGNLTGDSHLYIFATDFGGDSISIELKDGNPTGYTPFKLFPINVTNGQCRVGIHVTHGSAGNSSDMIDWNFHELMFDAVKSIFVSEISAWASNGMLTVRSDNVEITDIKIYSITGQMISSINNVNSNYYTGTLLEQGVFLVKVNTGEGNFTKKLVNIR